GHGLVRSRSSGPPDMSYLVPEKVADPPAPVTQTPQQPRIQEVREQNAIAGMHLTPDFVDGVPGIIGDGERITGIRSESHLRPSDQRTVRVFRMKHGAQMWCGFVGRKVELDGYAFPRGVCMR